VTRIGWYRNVKLLWILLQKEMMVVQPELWSMWSADLCT